MSLLKEFEINNTEVEEWLTWGGITLATVMQQKDGSCFSVIEYEPYEKNFFTKKLKITGLKNNAPVSGISLNGNVVTLSDSVLNQGTVTVSNGYSLKLGDDVVNTSTTPANWSVNGTTATYKASTTSAGYSLSSDSKTINYTNASGGNTLVTVTGLKNNASVSGINLSGNVVTLSNSVLNQGTVTVSNGYTLKLADNVPKSSITDANWSVSGTTATYKERATSAGYSISNDGKTINYTNASGGNTLVTVTGLKNNAPVSGISLNGNVVTLSDSVLNQGTVNVSNGYTLKLANDVVKSSITDANWSVSGTTATYKENTTSAGYSISNDGKTINYTNASGGNTLVTVIGLKNNAPVSGISLNGNVVTLSDSVLNQGTVTVTNGYTLKLADDVAKPSTTPANWSVNGTTATYKAATTSAGYSLSSDGKSINYINASVGNTLVTVTGLKNNAPLNGINLSGNVVTLSDSVLNQGTVTVTNGYTLKLADDVVKPSTTPANWSVNGTTATYKAATTSAGYSLSSDGKSINYINASGGNTLVTVSGLKSNALTSDISLNGNVVTLSNSVLNQGTVTVSNGYTLKLADDVEKSVTILAGWNISENTATYNTTSISEGYSLSDNGKTINYNTASGGNVLVTINGLKANAPGSGISLSGKVITLSNSVLNEGTVTVSDGYTLRLGNDVVKPATTNAAWSVNGTTATYKASATSAGYSLSSDAKTITYSNESTENTVSISGLKNGLSVKNGIINGISIKNNVVIVSSEIVGDEEVKITGNEYALEVIPKGLSMKNNILTASNQFTDTEINLNKAWESEATKVNAAAVSHNLVIMGNTASNSIKSGTGSDTLFGGLGNDTLTGGKGNDVFIYEGGNDVITDYKAGEDKIQMNLADVTKSSVKGSDVILTTDNGTLTVKGIKDNTITFIDDRGNLTDKIFFGNTSYEPLQDGLTYDKKRIALTASSQFIGNDINLESYLSTVTKVNATATSQDLNIVGNDSANSIKSGKGADIINGGSGKDTLYGGDGDDILYGDEDNDKLLGENGNDTLFGGLGNDTLTGSKGNDVFVYEGGNDVITDYKAGEDKIKMNLADVTKTSVKGSDVVLTTDSGTLTVKGIKDNAITFVDDRGNLTDKIFFGNTSYEPLQDGLTYDKKRIALTASSQFIGNDINLESYLSTVTKVNATATSQDLNIVGNDSANSIKSGKGADVINGGSGKDTLYGGDGDDILYGGEDNDKLLGENGNDTLFGGLGNDTLTGGKGNDVFVYEGGNDFITDYKVGEDKIKMNLSDVIKSSVKGSDVVLTTDNGTLTVKGIKDNAVTFVDNRGNLTDKIFFANMSYEPLQDGLTYDKKRIVLTASSQFIGNDINLENYLSTVTKVNATATSQDLNIVGNDSANSIKSGKGADVINGGSGKDTLYGGDSDDVLYGGEDNDKLLGEAGNDILFGGLGNDTLTGGKGNDVFVYEGGNDVITDYAAGQDTIKISGTISKVSYSGKNVIFTIGDGSLTVNKAKGKDINITDNYNQTQIYSKTFDLLYDNNFVADEFGIDEITEATATNYSLGEIEYSDNNNDFMNDSIVTASSFDEK